ncbi:FtsQ-type POTRA domain-containing protein [Phormidium sp. CLA17]|uniref:cell division protein FtsQ/DivIB n=1 Tax=Leptolyngbya sp. Cla-17 TaxID=2803751 RepID=UPI001490E1B6|nr:FtsQ-type POTRA domain-containing protein [Leptolyngbya sp. Cla-17]MBM0741768.1 FtsQ-type POTRA domain-containing protein [Leptolyngbya sp. Cla-17]
MAGNFTSPSQVDLIQRRQRLRRQRRVRLFQALWRGLTVTALAGGLVWVTTLPIWLIRKPEQIKVEGNRLIPSQALRSLVPIAYPQSLLQLKPEAIAKELKTKAPISDVVVNRQLFPPSLTIRVVERYPVAIVLANTSDIQLLSQNSIKSKDTAAKIGLLDENGMRLPLENYTLIQQSIKLPSLKVIGNPEHYRRNWSTLYREISRSPIKITELDFQNPANLILKTELGTIHLGPYGMQFSEQIKTLDRMRKLPNQVSLDQVAYIDLRNPDSPFIQTSGSKGSVKPDSP